MHAMCVHRRAYISVCREQDTLRVYVEEKLCVESMFLVRMESTPRAALMGTVSRETGFLRGRWHANLAFELPEHGFGVTVCILIARDEMFSVDSNWSWTCQKINSRAQAVFYALNLLKLYSLSEHNGEYSTPCL